jgi:hypothetical protein
VNAGRAALGTSNVQFPGLEVDIIPSQGHELAGSDRLPPPADRSARSSSIFTPGVERQETRNHGSQVGDSERYRRGSSRGGDVARHGLACLLDIGENPPRAVGVILSEFPVMTGGHEKGFGPSADSGGVPLKC